MSDHVAEKKAPGPWFNNQTYNALKFVAQILLPALGTLYAAVSGLWGFPAVEQVVGTIVAVDTFLGVILGISSAQYAASDAKYDGTMDISPELPDGSRQFNLNLNDHPHALAGKKEIAFKVVPGPAPQASAAPGDLPPVPPMH